MEYGRYPMTIYNYGMQIKADMYCFSSMQCSTSLLSELCVLWMDFKIVNPIPNWSWHLHLCRLQVVVEIFFWLRWNKCLRIQSLIAPMSCLQLFNALEEYNVINTHNSVFKVKFWRHAHTPWMEPCRYEYGVATSLCSALY